MFLWRHSSLFLKAKGLKEKISINKYASFIIIVMSFYDEKLELPFDVKNYETIIAAFYFLTEGQNDATKLRWLH